LDKDKRPTSVITSRCSNRWIHITDEWTG